MEKYTVDSIGDGLAVLLLRKDERVRITVAQEELPGVRAGEIISAEIAAGKVAAFQVEVGETAAARERIRAKLDKLKNRPRR